MHKPIYKILVVGILYLLHSLPSLSQSSSLVYYDQNKKLVYKADVKGNIVPDFSHVGYKNGEFPIPSFPVVKIVTPVIGDNLHNIQSAVDAVEALQPDDNGIRGAILLKAGKYRVNGRIMIKASGVALLGEGSDPMGTHIIATMKEQHDLVHFRGSNAALAGTSSSRKIISDYIPIGANSFVVADGQPFVNGERIFFERKPNQAWIELLNMHTLSQTDPDDIDWTPAAYTIRYKRKILEVKGDTIVLDAPVVDPIELEYAEAFILKYTWTGRIENVGIENIRLISEYSSENDENHGWNAIKFDNVEDGWVRNIEAHHFGYSAVNIGGGSSQISVMDSKCVDPISQTTGGRKYSFNVNGQRVLIKNCWTRGGRHDYVTGSRTAGPNVFVNCTAVNQRSNIGPHHRWATGLLFDNITGDGEIDVENRRNSGSGHGWAGAQTMFWNCTAKSIIVQDPPGEHINWAIGNKANVTGKGHFGTYPIGFIESTGKNVIPESLYEAQLAERLKYNKTPPGVPGNLKGRIKSDTQVQLTWDDSSGHESAFIVEMSENSGQSWFVVGVVSENVKSYSVTGLLENTQYEFRVIAKNAFGYSNYSNLVVATTLKKDQVTSLRKRENVYDLMAYPNPTSESVTIKFNLQQSGHVNLAVYDVFGREIKMIHNGFSYSGKQEHHWAPRRMKSGLYFINLKTGEDMFSVKMAVNN